MSLQFIAGKFQAFFPKIWSNKHIMNRRADSAKKGDFIMMLVEQSFFRLISFLNGLSYWCQIGSKWKIFWCSSRKKREKEIFSRSYHTRHKWLNFFRKTFLQSWLSVHQKHSRTKPQTNYFTISFIWDQSGICSSNRLEMRVIWKKSVLKNNGFFYFLL